VQLRDVQSGRVTATGTTDGAGAFSFNAVQPGTYTVEVLGGNQAVLAASSVLTLQAGDTLSVVLTLPIAASGGMLGSTAGTAAILIQNYSAVNLFRAQARLLIEDERSIAVPGVSADNYYEDPELYYKTQYRILKGRDLTRRVVRKLSVAALPEFNGTARPPVTPLSLLRRLESRVATLVRPAADDAPAARPRAETASESSLVDAFISRVDV